MWEGLLSAYPKWQVSVVHGIPWGDPTKRAIVPFHSKNVPKGTRHIWRAGTILCTSQIRSSRELIASSSNQDCCQPAFLGGKQCVGHRHEALRIKITLPWKDSSFVCFADFCVPGLCNVFTHFCVVGKLTSGFSRCERVRCCRFLSQLQRLTAPVHFSKTNYVRRVGTRWKRWSSTHWVHVPLQTDWRKKPLMINDWRWPNAMQV
jgi:hypothetical protein